MNDKKNAQEAWRTPLATMGDKAPADRLKELAAQSLSAAQIARILTAEGHEVTRCAVGAKADRMGVHLEGGNAGGRNPAARSTKRRAQETLPPVVEEAPIILDDGNHATILTINDRMCRWPIGDPCEEDFHFCGRKPKAGTPYCEAHARKMYQPQQQQRDRPSGTNHRAGRIQ